MIVGGGHNALVAASYLAKPATVTVLERLDTVGGAAVSTEAFRGVDARLSRYSYLVSLLPARIIQELGIDIRLLRRRYSSYTPDPGTERPQRDGESTTASFASIGAKSDASAWSNFYGGPESSRRLCPTVTEPLPPGRRARGVVGDDELWSALIERPIGEVIDRRSPTTSCAASC